MAWYHQATNHYLSQCWPRSMSPYGATRPQWVNILRPEQNGWHSANNILNGIPWIHCIFINISLKFISKGPTDNISTIGYDNGLALNRGHTLIWTKMALFTDTAAKLLSSEWQEQRTPLMVSQHQFRWWLGVFGQQTTVWADVGKFPRSQWVV